MDTVAYALDDAPTLAARVVALAAAYDTAGPDDRDNIRTTITCLVRSGPLYQAIAALAAGQDAGPLLAHVTTDVNGRLWHGSTCTIAGQTTPVPGRIGMGSHLGPARVATAIRALGYQPVDYYGTLADVDGGFTVQVEPT